MPAKPSPTTLRRQLGAELRRLRGERTAAEVTSMLGWSQSKLSRIETSHIGIRSRDLDALLDVYQIFGEARGRIRAMAAQSRQRAWWEVYGNVLPDAYETYIGFEAEAQTLREYNTSVVPGLLQTDEYAHAVIKYDSTSDVPEVVEPRVSVRMARRSVLTREPPLRLEVVLDEAVVHRPIGGPDVTRRQLRHLAEVAQRPTVILQVLPFSAGAHRGLAGSFVVLDFGDGAQPPLVYCDGMTGGVFRTKADDVRDYEEAFQALQAAAFTPEASQEFLARAAAEG